MFQKNTFNKFLKSLDNVQFGYLELTCPEGKKYSFQGSSHGAQANIVIRNYEVVINLITKGDIGFAEDYRDGKWESENLQDLFLFALQNQNSLNGYINGTNIFKILANILYYFNRNSLKGSKKNIHAHYDLGNDFYKLWLDESMTYSSGIFNDKNGSLASAQNNKYDRILDLLGEKSGEILEVGCGWGGFAQRAIVKNDHKIRGITLSEQQHKYANERLANYKDNSNIVLEDYRKQQGKFDHIVSIEMFEAVGEKFWPIYFSKISSLLKSKGKAVIQTITIDNDYFDSYRKSGDMIRSFIFPGGMLPSENRFAEEVKRANLKITDKYLFGLDYALTLEHWLNTFDSKIDQVKEQGFDEKFIRIWRLYLASCIAGFKSGRSNVMQVEVQHA